MRPSPLFSAVLALWSAGAADAATDRSPLPDAYLCRGDEPGWVLEIDGTRGEFQRFGGVAESVQALLGVPTRVEYLPRRTLVWRGRGSSTPSDVVAVLTEEACLSTMADEPPSPFRAVVTPEVGEVLVGCCRADRDAFEANPMDLADPAGGEGEDWTHYLADLWPAVEACLAQAGGGHAVVKAWPMNRGMAGARLRDRDGRRFDCVAPVTGAATDRYAPVLSDHDRLPDEGRPLFTPADGVPPAGACFAHRRVVLGERFVGWISTPLC